MVNSNKPYGSKSRYRAVSLLDLENVCSEKYDEVLSFSDLIDRFLTEKHARVRCTTFDSYTGAIERFIRPCFGKMTAREITPVQVRAWQNILMTLDYKPGYLRKINSLLCSIFKYGTRFHGLFTNPAALAGPIIARKQREEIHFWVPEEYGAFISYVKNIEKRLIFNILYWTGMRVGELQALTPSDIDLERGTISITKTYRRKGGEDIISPPKTPKSLRIIFINRSLAADIADYLSMYGPAINGGRIFRINLQTLRRAFYKLAAIARIPRIKLHDLRHSHASYLINNNCQIVAVSDRLGHEQIETTLDTYTHIYPKEPEQVATILEKEFLRLGCSLKMIGKSVGFGAYVPGCNSYYPAGMPSADACRRGADGRIYVGEAESFGADVSGYISCYAQLPADSFLSSAGGGVGGGRSMAVADSCGSEGGRSMADAGGGTGNGRSMTDTGGGAGGERSMADVDSAGASNGQCMAVVDSCSSESGRSMTDAGGGAGGERSIAVGDSAGASNGQCMAIVDSCDSDGGRSMTDAGGGAGNGRSMTDADGSSGDMRKNTEPGHAQGNKRGRTGQWGCNQKSVPTRSKTARNSRAKASDPKASIADEAEQPSDFELLARAFKVW